MADFTHELDVISDFFEVEEHSHYTAKPTAEHASERLSEVEELFRKSATFPDDGRRRALAVTLFANVLNVFVESVMWNSFDDDAFPLFSAQYGDRVDEWLNKVASVLQTVVHTDLTAPFALDGVNTFFWWYVAPLYEMGVVHNRIKSRGTPHTDREDVVEALKLLNASIGPYLPNPPPAHERPAGEATPGRRRQRTEA